MSTPARFKRGETLFGGNSVTSGSVAGLLGQHCYWDRDNNLTTTTQLRQNAGSTTIIVKNSAAAALLPGRIVKWKAGAVGKEVDGYTHETAGTPAGVVDDRLPAAGVAVGDYFHLVIKGPCLVLQSLANLTVDVGIEATGLLYALTAVTSGATSAGRFTNWVGTFAAADTTDGTAGKILRNAIGRAISTSVTTNTNGSVMAWLDVPWGSR